MCCVRSTKGNNDQSIEDVCLEGSEKKAMAQSQHGQVAFLHISRYPLLMHMWFPWPQGLSRLLWMDVVCRQVGAEGRCQTWAVGCRATSFPAVAWPELSGQLICCRASLQKMNHYK